MADLHHYIGDDLHLSPTGDLLVATGTVAGQQRVLRRLLTNNGDYIWHDYGAGLAKEVGQQSDERKIRGITRGEMFKEAAVSHNPDPAVAISSIKNGISARIQYVDATTGGTVSLAFDINR